VDETVQLTLSEFKAMLREQYFMLLIDRDATLAAIPSLLPDDLGTRRKSLAALQQVLIAGGELTGEAALRMERIAGLFGVGTGPELVAGVTPLAAARKSQRAKAS
jgi:hypothetical protein